MESVAAIRENRRTEIRGTGLRTDDDAFHTDVLRMFTQG
jgi:hypothetical protein